MLFSNPLRRAERQAYKYIAIKHTKDGIVVSKRGIGRLFDTLSKIKLPHKLKVILLAVFIPLIIFLLSVYIPAWIHPYETEEYYALMYDPQAIDANKAILASQGDKDFDNDGLTNREEDTYKTDPFLPDTDNDGFYDGYEVKHEMDPLDTDDLADYVEEQDKKAGTTLAKPYLDDSVILWPDKYKYKANGTVIHDQNSYIITGFRGWAQFPDTINNKVYYYDDGVLKQLKYRYSENAYYINNDGRYYVLSKEPDYYYRIGAFGTNYISHNGFFGNILSFLLPSHGRTWLKCQKIAELPNQNQEHKTIVRTFDYTNTYEDRLSACTNSLENLSSVWNAVRSGTCVYVSLFNPKVGESIGIIYGYDKDMNLLVADPTTKGYAGTLHINIKAKNVVKEEKVERDTWFDFSGLGFDSTKGHRINFFGIVTDQNYTHIF